MPARRHLPYSNKARGLLTSYILFFPAQIAVVAHLPTWHVAHLPTWHVAHLRGTRHRRVRESLCLI